MERRRAASVFAASCGAALCPSMRWRCGGAVAAAACMHATVARRVRPSTRRAAGAARLGGGRLCSRATLDGEEELTRCRPRSCRWHSRRRASTHPCARWLPLLLLAGDASYTISDESLSAATVAVAALRWSSHRLGARVALSSQSLRVACAF